MNLRALPFVLLTTVIGLRARAETTAPSAAAAYPFELPAELNAVLDIDTGRRVVVDRMLLGMNCGWPENSYGGKGYDHPDARKLILALKPAALRFPHGVWSNFYDWESDGRRITDGYSGEYAGAVRNHPGLKYGFAGFHRLHDELKFDVLFTWNVNYDSPEKGVRRLRDHQAKGFAVKWIELGNETFWKSQRSEATSSAEKYIEVAGSHAAALKAADPAVRVSVPVHWRAALTDPWNMALMPRDFFDAVSVHRHLNKKGSVQDLRDTLSARGEVTNMGRMIERAFPKRSIWLSEWSVSCNDQVLTTVGVVDTLLGILAEPGMFETADYFQMNAKCPVVLYDRKTRTHTRTGVGAAFQIVCDAFEGGERHPCTMNSTKITDGLDAVSAEAAVKDGKLRIVAINKTPRPVPLVIHLDGRPAGRTFTHRVLQLERERTYGMTENLLTEVPGTTDPIVLPPLSISRIDLADPVHGSDQK